MTTPIAESGSALRSIYSTANPNDTIQFYDGPLTIEQNGIITVTCGTVNLEWLRYPAIKFNITESNSTATNDLKRFTLEQALLRLPICQDGVKVHVLQRNVSVNQQESNTKLSGNVLEPIRVGTGHDLTHMLVHLPNFCDTLGEGICNCNIHWMGRFVLEENGWKLTVDKVDNHIALYKSLNVLGGYAITHIAKLERINGNPFNAEQTSSLLEDMSYFFSFTRGFWTGPTMELGFDKNGNRVWEKWNKPITNSWRYVNSWFNSQKPQVLADLWPGFYQRLHDVTWEKTIKQAIHWYVAGNTLAGELEGAIILAQTGHELLAWTLFVAENQLTTDGFEKLPASDKLRLLLLRLKIPLAVPSSLVCLSRLCKSEKWVDGPHAVTDIRNKLVHPKPKNLQRISTLPYDALRDAHNLGLWYLELILLYLFNYKGDYANRLPYQRYAGQVEPVPWLLP